MADVPGSFNPIAQPSVVYNKPVSEASIQAMASSINGLLTILLPVGSIIDSMLTEPQFQAQIGNPSPATWVLADGRSAAGTGYNSVTGEANIPDLRGIFRRGKNGTRSDGNQNPDGNLALGTFTDDKFESHSHVTPLPLTKGDAAAGVNIIYRELNLTTTVTSDTGSNETAPKNVTVNTFIRLN